MLDVIVVGAGPAGSAAAAILARRGCRVLALEQARFPRPKPCGDYLNPGCGAALARLGALEAVRSAAVPVSGMRIVAPDGTATTTTFSIGTGFALRESNVHSPNERLRVEDVDRAVAAASELYRSLAALG